MTLNAEDSRVGTTFGKYKITGVLGKGGMGEVYEAYDNQINRAVALKIIKSEYADDRRYRTRFERESHAAAKLQEPHVIPIHGYGEIDGCLFIDMRLVRGADLQSLIDKAPLNPSRAVAVIAQIAAALDAAHAEGLIHRDVKPQNIIVTPADFAYLVDFGIAESVGEADTRLTAMGAQIGSWVYMAPERFTDKDLTPSVDIYSLTCVLYESLTGQTPFPAVLSGSARRGALDVSAPATKRHESGNSGSLRRRHRARHGQGTRRPLRQRGRIGARGQSGTAGRRPHVSQPGGIPTDTAAVAAYATASAAAAATAAAAALAAAPARSIRFPAERTGARRIR